METLDVSELSSIPKEIKYRGYDGLVYSLKPSKILAFSGPDLPFETQATTYFMVTQLAEIANLDVNNKKDALTRVRGSLYYWYSVDKDLRKDNGNRKPSDAVLQSLVDSNDKVKAAMEEYNVARYKYNTLNNLVKAFEQRKDLMQSLSAKKRAELQTGQNTL